MTTKTRIKLTNKEKNAIVAISKHGVKSMGGKEPSDLLDDNFSWFRTSDIAPLMEVSIQAANGVLAGLDKKHIISQPNKKGEWAFNEAGINEAQKIWEEKGLIPKDEEKELKKPAKQQNKKKEERSNSAKTKPAEKEAEKPKKEKAPSPYGIAVELVCQNPDITKKDLLEKAEEKGVDVEKSKSSLLTGFNQTRKIVSLLRQNKHMN